MCLDGAQTPPRTLYTGCDAHGADAPIWTPVCDDRAAADAQPAPGPDAHGGRSSTPRPWAIRGRRGMERRGLTAADLDRHHAPARCRFGRRPRTGERANEPRSADDRPDGDSGLRSGRCRGAVRDSFPVWSPLQWRHPGGPDPRPCGRCPGREFQHARGNSWLREAVSGVARGTPRFGGHCDVPGAVAAPPRDHRRGDSVAARLFDGRGCATGECEADCGNLDSGAPPATPGRDEAQRPAYRCQPLAPSRHEGISGMSGTVSLASS